MINHVHFWSVSFLIKFSGSVELWSVYSDQNYNDPRRHLYFQISIFDFKFLISNQLKVQITKIKWTQNMICLIRQPFYFHKRMMEMERTIKEILINDLNGSKPFASKFFLFIFLFCSYFIIMRIQIKLKCLANTSQFLLIILYLSKWPYSFLNTNSLVRVPLIFDRKFRYWHIFHPFPNTMWTF